MSLWRQAKAGVWRLIRPSEAERDIRDEVAHFLEQSGAAAVHRTPMEEELRSHGWENVVSSSMADLRHAARRLRRAPGFTAVAVLTLALGIGGTTAIFSAVYPVLFAPLPYPDAGRVVAIREVSASGTPAQGSWGMYHELAGRLRGFSALAVFSPWTPILTGQGRPEPLGAQRVSLGYFQVLGVTPSLGRDFSAADDQPGGPNVVIISRRLWRRLGADRAIVGRRVTLEEARGFSRDDRYEVIGVMPAFENVLAPAADVWAPLQVGLSQGRAWGHWVNTVGRLRPGVTLEQAAGEVGRTAAAVLGELHPPTYGEGVSFRTTLLQDDMTRSVRPALLAIASAVLLVLVIACVNVTNLLLARGVNREPEFALRAALGAGRRRLVRQVLTESVLLASFGGMAGLLVAAVGVRVLVALSPVGLPRADAIRMSPAVLLFGIGVTLLVSLAFGIVPALHAVARDPQPGLQGASGRTTGGHGRTRGALVIAEVALALVLLVSSGLLLRSLNRLFAVDSGFDPSRLLTMKIQTVGVRYWSDSTTYQFFARVLDEARRIPGVTAAALTTQLPLSGDLDQYGARLRADLPQGVGVFRYVVTPEYLRTMRIPLLRGRTLDDRDIAGATRVAVISAQLARDMFPTSDPIGQRIYVGPARGEPFAVVGVVGDIRQQSLAETEADAVYIPLTQWHWADDALTLVVRGDADPARLAPALTRAIGAIDPDQPVTRVALMSDLLAATAGERRFALILFEAFALSALVLAAAGIHGVLAHSVAGRTREIGIRAALGASRGRILAQVGAQGMTLVAVGLLLGVIGAALASRLLATLLFGISRLDPVTYGAVIAVLLGVSALACGVPAWRAARVDPAITLRSE